MELVLRNPGAAETNTGGWYLFIGSAAPLLADEVEAQTGVAWLDGDTAGFRAETEFKGGMFSSAKALMQDQLTGVKWFGVINQFYALLAIPGGCRAASVVGHAGDRSTCPAAARTRRASASACRPPSASAPEPSPRRRRPP